MTIRPEIEKIVKKTSTPLPRTCNLWEKIKLLKAKCSNQVLSQASGPRYAVPENARFYLHVWRARDDVHVWRLRDDVHAWRARHPMHVMTFMWWRTRDNMSVLTWCGHPLWEPLSQSTHKSLFLYFFLFLFFFNCRYAYQKYKNRWNP